MSIYLPRRSVIARWRKNGWDEPCKSRGLRTVLWAAGGEIPPADPATVLRRIPKLRLTNLDSLKWHPRNTLRGVISLTGIR
jgi:hypothetical protein